MPTATIFLHGHGGWKPDNGYTTVPRNSSLSFYTHFAKLLNQTMVVQILQNSYAGELERTVGEFQTVPNLRLSSLSVGLHNWATGTFVNGGGRNLWMLPPDPPHRARMLSDLMAGFRENVDSKTTIDFRWLCCQALGLKQAGGRAEGVNASDRTAQAGHEGEYLFKWTDSDGVAHQKWVKSNSSIHS